MTAPETVDPLTAERRAFRDRLSEHQWLLTSRSAALPGLGPQAVAVYDGLAHLIADTASNIFTTDLVAVRFPPVFAIEMLEQTDYVASFPQLLGTINAFLGGQSEYRQLVAEYDRGGDWQAALAPTGLAVAPAACHPLYSYLENSIVDARTLYEMTGECFRHEPSEDPMRLISFRMREYVRLGTEEQTKEHRRRWLEIDQELFAKLQLPVDVVVANDPFFGRGGTLLATNQIEAEAKFEVVTEVYGGTPTAIASANFHGEHFGQKFALSLPDGSVAQSACAAFGMERIVFALAHRHGFELAGWPARVRSQLGLA